MAVGLDSLTASRSLSHDVNLLNKTMHLSAREVLLKEICHDCSDGELSSP